MALLDRRFLASSTLIAQRRRSRFTIPAAFVTASLWAASSSAWAQQVTVFSENFSGGTISATKFPTASEAAILAAPSGEFPTGNALYFSGGNGGTRAAVTQTLNLSAGNADISFKLHYFDSTGAGTATFDPFETGDDIILSYSTDGVTFTTINTFAANSNSYENVTTAWNTYSAVLPNAAFTATTRFRWFQPNHGNGSAVDQWAIDDIVVRADMVAVPEPGTWALFGLGSVGLLVAVLRRRAQARHLERPAIVPGAESGVAG